MKQGKALQGLRSTHARLVRIRQKYPRGYEREQAEEVQDARLRFVEAWLQVHTRGLDPTSIADALNRRLKPSEFA